MKGLVLYEDLEDYSSQMCKTTIVHFAQEIV